MELKYSLTNDHYFKKYFTSEGGEKRTRKILELLGIDLCDDKLIITTNETNNDVEAKSSRFDIRIKNGVNEIDLEAQVLLEENKSKASLKAHNHRRIHYGSQIHSNIYAQGETYILEKKTYVIFFTEYKLSTNNVIERTMFTNEASGEKYNDIMLIDVSLKLAKMCANIELREILEVFNTHKKISVNTNLAKEAMNMIIEWNHNPDEKWLKQRRENDERWDNTLKEIARTEGYEEGREEGRQEGIKEGRQEGIKEGRQEGLKEGRQEGIKEGRQEGIKEGRQEGIKEGRQEGIKEGQREKAIAIAQNMLKNNMEIELISEITGLSIEEIKKIES